MAVDGLLSKATVLQEKGRNNRETKTFQAALQPIYFQYITHFTRLFHFSGTQYVRNAQNAQICHDFFPFPTRGGEG